MRACTTNAPVLGHSFQGKQAVKEITSNDHQILTAAAANLPLEPRARILPEEELEAALQRDDPDRIANLIKNSRAGIAEERRAYIVQLPHRNRQLVAELHKLYNGQCQICLWSPKKEYGHYLCHGHHIQWLSQGGEGTLTNMVLVCPNHHAAIHGCDACFDFGDMSFDFGTHRIALGLNQHL